MPVASVSLAAPSPVDDMPLPPQHRSPVSRWALATLLAQIALGILAMSICLPSMRSWEQTFSATPSSVQLTFSGFLLAFGVLQLVFGPLSDMFGRRRFMLVGLALAAVGSCLCALAESLPVLIVGRFLQGAGCAAGMVVGRAKVQDLFDGPERTRVMAMVGMVAGLCPPAATLVGGQLHVALGWRAGFVAIVVLSCLLFVGTLLTMPADAASTRRPAGHWFRTLWGNYVPLSREMRFHLYVLVVSMTSATFYTFLSGAPFVLDRMGVGPAQLGWYILCIPLAYIAGNYVSTQLVRRRGERALMVAGHVSVFLGLGLALALGAAGLHTPLAFALPMMAVGLGHGLVSPSALSGTVGLMPALAGTAAAVAGLIQQVTGAAAGVSVGLVSHADASQLLLLMVFFSSLSALGLVGLQAMDRRSRLAG